MTIEEQLRDAAKGKKNNELLIEAADLIKELYCQVGELSTALNESCKLALAMEYDVRREAAAVLTAIDGQSLSETLCADNTEMGLAMEDMFVATLKKIAGADK